MISVIMSVFNGEEFISQAIDSVLNQSYEDFELLITNDCSTDKTLDIMEGYSDKRIRIINNSVQKGLTDNLIAMVLSAKGEYIARLDADDYCALDRFQKQVEYLKKHPDVFMVASYAAAIGDKSGFVKLPTECADIHANLLFQNIIVHSSVMFHNDPQVYNYDSSFKKSQDYDLWDRVVADGLKMAIIPEQLVYYRYHQGQITNRNGGEQTGYANLVRIRALNRLGISLETQDEDIYLNFISLGTLSKAEDAAVIERILKQIKQQNKKYLLYNQKSLTNIINNYTLILIGSIRKGAWDIDRQWLRRLYKNVPVWYRLKSRLSSYIAENKTQ